VFYLPDEGEHLELFQDIPYLFFSLEGEVCNEVKVLARGVYRYIDYVYVVFREDVGESSQDARLVEVKLHQELAQPSPSAVGYEKYFTVKHYGGTHSILKSFS